MRRTHKPETSEAKIRSHGDAIVAAARVLIGMVRITERIESGRSTSAQLDLEIELTGGGVETWTITIERTASAH